VNTIYFKFTALAAGILLFTFWDITAQEVIADASSVSSSVSGAQTIFRIGSIDISPSFTFRSTYDDNIRIQPTNKESDVVWTISPGIMMGAGDYVLEDNTYLQLNYSPSIIRFTENSDQDSIDHDLFVEGRYRFSRLAIDASHRYQILSGSSVEVGNRIDRALNTTFLGFNYEHSPKTSITLDLLQELREYTGFSNESKWIVSPRFRYELTPKIFVGSSARTGYVEVQDNSDQVYQEFSLRFDYLTNPFLTTYGEAGVEFRKFLDSGSTTEATPIFLLGLNYQPLDRTSFNLEAYRRSSTSISINSSSRTATGFTTSARQTLFDNLFIELRGSYENSDYDQAITLRQQDREDDYFLISTEFEYLIQPYWRASITYQFQENTSTDNRRDFTNNQIQIQSVIDF
jgi:hypothetical protein